MEDFDHDADLEAGFPEQVRAPVRDGFDGAAAFGFRCAVDAAGAAAGVGSGWVGGEVEGAAG